MAKLKCSCVLLFLCALCTLTSAAIKDELKFLSKGVPVIRTQRHASTNLEQLVAGDYKEILEQFENTVDACNDAYSIVCFNNVAVANETITLKTIRNSILNILKTPPIENDLASLKIEKNLFHNCMNLGQENYYIKEQTLADFEYIVYKIYDHVAFHPEWQSLDEFLSALGFGHAFYEIKVEREPENYVNKIVVLQPPSHVHVQRMKELINKILNSSNDLVNDDVWNIWKFFEAMKRNKYEIESFFVSLLEIISNSNGKNAQAQHKYVEKSTLNSWQKNNLYSSNVAQINWTSVISQEFERVNYQIGSNEGLLIKNEQYFLSLYELLNSTSNNLISAVILTKMLAEQLPYIDWENFQALKPVTKEEFCFEETKLYGASFEALQSFKRLNINGISSKITLNTLNNIVSVLNADISGTYALSAKQRRYLKNELFSITSNILEQDIRAVDGYYEDYQPIRIYFTDILNYRKVIRNKELSTLRDSSKSTLNEMQIYSIMDLYKPRNRFLTKLLTINMTLDVPMHRVIYYSKYAPEVAQFLYSLLNENRFADYKQNFEGSESELHTYPIFSASIIDCYWNSMSQAQNQNKKFIKHTLTTMFGLHIAYEAMLNDYAIIGASPGNIQVSDNNWIAHDKLFFISYLKNHCTLGSNVLNEIFSKSDLIRNSICYNRSGEVAGCKQEPFGIQSKHIFLS